MITLPEPDVLWPSEHGAGEARRSRRAPLARMARVRHLALDAPLALVGASDRVLWLAGARAARAVELASLEAGGELRGVSAPWSEWTGEGTMAAVVDDDLVYGTTRELVRRDAAGAVVARAPIDGPAPAVVPCGARALVGGARATTCVELARAAFGRACWTTSDGDAAFAPRAYDPRGVFRPGEALWHPTFGAGVVQRSLGDARMLVAFDAGGRSVRGVCEAASAAGAAPARLARPRTYGLWMCAGEWAWLGYRDGRSGEHKVKGVEAIERRALRSGAEHVLPGLAAIECAAAARDEPERVVTGHFPLAADERGLVLAPYASDAGVLHEIGAADGELRWSLAALPARYVELVALGPDHVVVVGPADDDDAHAVVAVDRDAGRVAWVRRVPTGGAAPVVALADAVVYLAWAREETALWMLDAATGAPRATRARLGRTLAPPERAGGAAVAIVPYARGVALVTTLRRARTLVTLVDA